ncbi:vWA domain-containing protein [Marinomonas sp. IMCC 4694]|uniref:vWA domain-containing protein n=1 Tax=Marinomonas sp. IMCC 4694 TaxID=2605432 RepID=UPI0011E7F3D5|nr:vWA domain-containing protein [Marinomonas sp. IMCC 4694]TYL48126.1 VWA domain-containing protein [Marinomonas sp. IMCC 4694]
MTWLRVNAALLLSVCLSFGTPLSHADTQFRVIVDASGSMIISDPDKLTSEALRLISSLAPEEQATLGIWLFGEEPRVLLEESIVNKASKAKLESYVNSYVTQDVKTDLEAIIALLLDTPDSGDLRPNFSRHWVLVTDGMVDISLDESVNKASRDRILNELTAKLEAKNIHLHTISMTGYTDKNLLESLSLRTGATHTEVAIPEDLLDTFDRIFAQATPTDELPFDGNRFLVDDAIEELTLVVFHDEGVQPHVIKPDGSVLSLINSDSVSVSSSNHYTLLTVRRPSVGLWQVDNVDLERSSIRIMTNLSVQASTVSSVVFLHEPIYSVVGLFQKEELIDDEKVLDLLDVNQSVYRLNGSQKELITTYRMTPSGEQFQHALEGIRVPGNYELLSLVDGKTFSRQISQFFTVHPAIDFNGLHPGGDLVAFTAKPVNLKLNVVNSAITLEFSYSNGTQKTDLMPLVGQGYWEAVVPVSANELTRVRAQLKGVTQTGVRFDYWTPTWEFGRQGDAIPTVRNVSDVIDTLTTRPVSISTLDNGVTPVVVSPLISVVSENLINAEDPTNTLSPEAVFVTDIPSQSDAMSGFTASDWAWFAGLNIGGILVIAGGIWAYRRRKKTPSQGDEDNV